MDEINDHKCPTGMLLLPCLIRGMFEVVDVRMVETFKTQAVIVMMAYGTFVNWTRETPQPYEIYEIQFTDCTRYFHSSNEDAVKSLFNVTEIKEFTVSVDITFAECDYTLPNSLIKEMLKITGPFNAHSSPLEPHLCYKVVNFDDKALQNAFGLLPTAIVGRTEQNNVRHRARLFELH